ncbi:hypothetical protein Ancab_040124 [Ancistrocladus abbreviatus]
MTTNPNWSGASLGMRPEDHPSSPYHLHPNENPALVLVPSLLTGPNFHTWSRSMKMALLSKNKQGFVDGSINAPSASDPMYGVWQRCNTMVLSWITRALSPSIAQSILWIDKAVEVWKDLEERFSQSDAMRISELQEELHTFKQGCQTVTEYYTALKIVWDELNTLRPVPLCSCEPRCSCAVSSIIKKYFQEDFAIRFLKGLNENYATVRLQLMLMDVIPPINKVFSLVAQQERQIAPAVECMQNPDRTIAVVQSGTRVTTNSKSSKKPVCSHCNIPGHTVEQCYKKHGYPPGHKGKFKNASGNQPVQRLVNAVHEGAPEQPLSTQPAVVSNAVFTPEQYTQLLALLQQSNRQKSEHHVNALTAHFSSDSVSDSGTNTWEDDWVS